MDKNISDIIFRTDGKEWQVRGGELSPEDRDGLYEAAMRCLAGRERMPLHDAFPFGEERFRLCMAETIDGPYIFLRRINHVVPDIREIGLPHEICGKLLDPARRGLIIVGGSMGSGKTTTAAAICRGQAEQGRNCITLEDPPEYDLQGRWNQGYCYQMRITPETLAQGVATVKRQGAPELIHIGEIRDAETARQGLIEANIGHYVLTTIHASSVENILWRYMAVTGSFEDTSLHLVMAEAVSFVLHQELHKMRNGTVEVHTSWVDFDDKEQSDYLRNVIREKRPYMLNDRIGKKVCLSHI